MVPNQKLPTNKSGGDEPQAKACFGLKVQRCEGGNPFVYRSLTAVVKVKSLWTFFFHIESAWGGGIDSMQVYRVTAPASDTILQL